MQFPQTIALLFLLHAVSAVAVVADEGISSGTQPQTDRNATNNVSQHSWPSIRGSAWNGISSESNLVDHWPKEGPPVLWTRELGQGYSAFVAWDKRVATQYQTLRGQFVSCFDANTGATLWEYRYDWPYDPAGVYPGPRATPTYHDGCLYFASPAGLIGCLSADTGRLIWSVDLSERFKGELTGFGYACSPTVVDDKVILPVGCPDAALVALNTKTGTVIWQAGNYASSYAPAFPVTFRGRRLVIGYGENAIVGHDLQTGKVLWEHKLSEGYDEHSSWPLYDEPYLWISSPFKAGAELLELTDDETKPIHSSASNH
jgi:outer membrane protein assembly factor BamB